MLRAFEAEQLEYVLIGATAMGFHGLVRATEEDVARLRRAFHAVYTGDSTIDEIRAVDLQGDYPALRYYPRPVTSTST